MKNTAITPTRRIKMSLSDMRAFWLIGKKVSFAPVDLICYCVNDTRVKIQFQKQHIFGVQFIGIEDLNKLLIYGHKDREYRICICAKETPEDQIREILL